MTGHSLVVDTGRRAGGSVGVCHAHCSSEAPDRTLYVADLGTDEIYHYRIHETAAGAESAHLEEVRRVCTGDHTGPQQIALASRSSALRQRAVKRARPTDRSIAGASYQCSSRISRSAVDGDGFPWETREVSSSYATLTDDQVASFLEKGYLVVKECLDPHLAARLTDRAFERLGYDRHDQSTWTTDIVWMDRETTFPVAEVAPKAWAAVCDVVGGEERIEDRTRTIESKHFTTINSFEWSDAFVANFYRGADRPWDPPSASVEGWHKDGSFFRHFLDSPEQALLTIVLWSDVHHRGGGTFIAPDSVRVVARFLADHPEGVHPRDIPRDELIRQCTEFEELTGEVGDFIIMHPFMLHASSQNVLRTPRFITNPPILLKEPLNLNRPDPADFSLLERATLGYLGVDRLEFRPTSSREAWWT